MFPISWVITLVLCRFSISVCLCFSALLRNADIPCFLIAFLFWYWWSCYISCLKPSKQLKTAHYGFKFSEITSINFVLFCNIEAAVFISGQKIWIQIPAGTYKVCDLQQFATTLDLRFHIFKMDIILILNLQCYFYD